MYLHVCPNQPMTFCRRSSTCHVVLTMLGAIMLLATGCQRTVSEPVGRSPSDKSSLETLEKELPARDLYADLIQSNEQYQLLESLTRKLKRFEGLVQSYVRLGSKTGVSRPGWVSAEFGGQGINWDGFSNRFRDDSTTIGRWQANQEAPQYSGQEAFEQFIGNSFTKWEDASDFLLDLKPYSSKWLEDELETRLVVEIYGQTQDGVGLQATAIWFTRWQVSADRQELKLASVNVRAQEQVALKVAQGRLFHDCTESILASTGLMEKQLNYGLDQWAARIPGIDIVGDQGIAVGDVDGDGLDDLYVCQANGLPNLLLMQNPDGSVTDASAKAGVDLLDHSRGALIVDLDNDGDQDLAITTDMGLVLMSQKRGGEFQLEHELSIGHNGESLTAADYDQDGDLDLFICKHRSVKTISDLILIPESRSDADSGGRNVLLRNDEGWNFSDVTNQSGFTPKENRRHSRSAVWTDFDLDGDQDLYVANEWSSDQLFRNDKGWFTEVSEGLGMAVAAQHRSVSTGEFNLDGKPDLFVATDSPLSAWQRLSGEAPEIEKNSRQDAEREAVLGENQIWFSKSVDSETGKRAGFDSFFLRAPIFSAESSYSSVAADVNNDGLDDVIVTNGHLSRYSSDDIGGLFYSHLFSDQQRPSASQGVVVKRPIEEDMLRLVRSGISIFGRQRNRCYLSIGNLGFANFSGVSGVDYLDDARAVATTDWDNDGDVDIVMTARNGPQLRILSNANDKRNGFLHFKLVGTRSNRDAIGARVELFLQGRDAPLVKFVTAGSGNLSQSSKRLFFGLGNKATIEKAVVTWPDGEQQSFANLVANTRYTITEGDQKLAETNNERFQLVLKRSANQGEITIPESPVAHFQPVSWLPNIEYQSSNEKWYSVSPIRKSYTTVLFCDGSIESKKAVQRIGALASSYQDEKYDAIAIFIDRSTNNDQQRLENAQRFFEEQQFPFHWGVASKASIQKLEYYFGHWFSKQQLPKFPVALSMARHGQITSCHFLGGVDQVDELPKFLEKLAAKDDIDLENNPQALTLKPDPQDARRGIWMNRYRTADFSRLVALFRDSGFERTANEMFYRSRPHMAFQLTQHASELVASGDQDAAMKFYNRGLKLFPGHVPALVGRGNLIRKQALGHPEDDLTLRIQELNEAAEHFSAALKIDPFNTDAILGKSNVMIDNNNVSLAIKELAAYLKVDPARAEIHAVLGRLYFSKRDFNLAAAHLLAAYELRPTLPYVAGDLGYMYLSSGQAKLGRQFLRLSNRLQPSDRNVIKHLAQAEFANGNFTEAVALLKKTLTLLPNHRRSKQLLAWLLATSPFEEDRDGVHGQKLIEPLVTIMGDRSPMTLEVYAACFAEAGDFEQAVNLQEQALKLVRSERSGEHYLEPQKNGLVSRLELYKRQRPYRTADLTQIPIRASGKTTDVK